MKLTTLRHYQRLISKGIAALALAAFTILPARAESLTWDSNVTSGAWDLTENNWVNATGPTAWTQTSTTSPLNDAVFGGSDGTYTVSIGGTQMAVNNLAFNASGYTIQSGSLYLPSTGTTTVAAGKTATINSFVVGGNNVALKMTINGVLNLGGGMNNPQWSPTGSGTINITGGTYDPSITNFTNAATNQTGGVVKFDRGGSGAGYFVGANATRNTNYTISSGTLSVNSTGAGAYFGIGRNSSGYTSTMSIQGDSVVNIGTVATRYGQLNIVSNDGLTNGLLDVQGGTLNVGTNGFAAASKIYFSPSGLNAGKTSIWQQSGGTVNTQGIQFGASTTASYSATASAKLLFTGGNIYVGDQGITQASGSSAYLPVTIALGGGTLGALADWSSSLNMGLTGSNGNVTIQAATASGAAKNITLSGILSGTGGFTKTGSGTVTLNGANTYTGSAAINEGILSIGAASALPGYNTNGRYSVANGATLAVANPVTDSEVAEILGTTNFAVGAALGFDTSAGDRAYSAVLANTGQGALGLTKLGSNTLTLSASNTYTGDTTVSSGTLRLSDSTLAASSKIANHGVLIIDQVANSATFANQISGSGTVAKTGVNQLLLSGSSTYSGGTLITGGILKLGGTYALGSGGVTVGSGATLDLNGINLNGTPLLTISGSGSTGQGAIYNAGAGVGLKLALADDATINTVSRVDLNTAIVGNNKVLTKIGGNILNAWGRFDNNNSVAAVNVKEGTLYFEGNTNTTTAFNVSNGAFAGFWAGGTKTTTAPFNLDGGSTLGNFNTSASGTSVFSGPITLNGAANIKPNSGNLVLSGTISGLGGLTQATSGTSTLSGNNDYTGATNVNAGKIFVSGSLAGTTTVSVASGATLTVNGGINALSTATISGTLNGTGALGTVKVANGGVLAPGDSAGILSMVSLSGTTGAKLSIELGKTDVGAPVAGTDYDQVSTGSILLNNMTLTLVATAGTNVEIGDKFFLIINQGVDAIDGTFAGLAQGSTFTANGMEYQVSYTANWDGNYSSSGMVGGNDVALLAVPEPSTYAFLLGGLGLLFQFQRLRKQRVGTR